MSYSEDRSLFKVIYEVMSYSEDRSLFKVIYVEDSRHFMAKLFFFAGAE